MNNITIFILLSFTHILSAQDCADDPTGVYDPMGGFEAVIGWVTCDGAFADYTVSDICTASCGSCSSGPSGCDLPDMSLSILSDGSVL